jgi:hypothetical protein
MGGSPENTVLHPLHQVQFATHAKLKVDDYYHNGGSDEAWLMSPHCFIVT